MTRRIGISLGNIDRFVDGLGEFSQQLGLALAARAPALRAARGIELHFHTVPALHGCFGSDVGYLAVRRTQEWWHRQPLHFDVWHVLNQLNRYPAPQGTAQRLLTVHDLNFVHVKTGYSRWRDARRLRRLLARNDRIVTISDHVGADLRRHLGFGGATLTIHNGARNLAGAPQEAVAGLEGLPFLFHISRHDAVEERRGLAGDDGRVAREDAGAGRALGRAQRRTAGAGQGPRAAPAARADDGERRAEGLALRALRGLRLSVARRRLRPAADRGAALRQAGVPVRPHLPARDRRRRRHLLARLRTGLDAAGRRDGPGALRPAQAERARAHAAGFTWERAADAYLQAYGA